MNLIQHFINGKVVGGSSRKTSKVFNPATGEQSSEVNLASKADVDLTVQKAKEAFTDWCRKLSIPLRIPSGQCCAALPAWP